MQNNVLNEYTNLLKTKFVYMERLSALPKGYISKKTIGNKEYHYLQFRNGGKVESKYLKDTEVSEMTKLFELRKEAESALPKIEKRLGELEMATKLLDVSLFRRLAMLKISVGMDDICREDKEKCVSFADAMTSIEGVSISMDTKHHLNDWKDGNVSFLSIFEQTLKQYGFAVEA